MSPRLNSLRNRLVAGMLSMFGVGIAAERPLEEHIAALGRFGPDLLREPYQDIAMLIPFGLGAVALTWVISGWSLRHLASASREAGYIGPAAPNARISTNRLPEEIRPLVDAVNGALERLSDAYEAERRFVADAAHELRTPLAVLSLRLQRAKLDSAFDWTAIEQDTLRVNRLLDQLLTLARSEHARQAGVKPDATVVNMSRIAREAAAAVIPLAEEADRSMEVELAASLPVHAQADDLRDVVRNLLENAVIHGRGTIRLSGRVETIDDGKPDVVVTVSDEGEGVPADRQEEMFARFRKGRQNSPGHGLGLAIAREIAVGHGGTISFLPAAGCQVRLALPSARADPPRGPGLLRR